MELIAANASLPPGVRFHPTDVELVMHYLKRKVQGKRLEPELVAEVDIYQFHPEDLRERACLNKDLNWYFFCAIGKKYHGGGRANRATPSGYWKATGRPRVVLYSQRSVGKVQTLVFHQGKPKNAERTDWVMYEYTLVDSELDNKDVSDAFVLCKIFKKSGVGPRNGEQYGAPYIEEEWDEEEMSNNAPTVPVVSASVVINGSVSANAYPVDTPELVLSGAVSVSVVDQAPTPTSDAANVASTSKGIVPDYDEAAHQVLPDAIPEASSSKNPVPNDAYGMYCADKDEQIYEDLEDLGIELDDLDTPLFS